MPESKPEIANLSEEAGEIAMACRQLAREGLFVGTAGNISVRAGSGCAVTTTGLDLVSAAACDVVTVDAAGEVTCGEGRPSSEVRLHLDVYAADDAVNAVVHTHSPSATAVSLIADELPCVHYQQLLLGGAVPVVPFAVFGSEELAAAVRVSLSGRKAVLLANHGTVTTGATLKEALDNARLLEWMSELYLRAAAVASPRRITPEQQRQVIEAVLERGYGTTQQS